MGEISDIQRRIVMLWDSRGAAQVRSSIGQMQQGLSGYNRQLQQVNREQGVLEKQMRAFGTTFRYAIAGGAIFGTMNAIRNLGQFQAAMGEISAIGSSDEINLTGDALDRLGQKLLKVSTDTATPIQTVQEAVTNLYSTIEGITPDQAVTAIETIARTARISQADITDTTQALLGMMNAFDERPKDLPAIGDEFFRVTQLAAGGVNFAKVYAQQLGRLSQGARQGGFTQEEMGALAIASSRFGGSTATNLRGLAQLLRVVKTPSNKKSEAFYAQAGLAPYQRRDMGGYEVLMQLLTYANSLTPGRRQEFMAGAFTRSESRNVATVLGQLMTRGQIKPGTKNLTIAEYLDRVKDSAGAADEAMARAMDTRRIQQAGNAMSNFSIAFASAFNPLIQPAAKGVISASSAFQDLAAQHPYGVMGATGALGAALVLARRAGRNVPSVGRGLAGVGAVGDVLQGGKVRGDSPLNPLYVIVVSQLTGPKGFLGRNQFPGGQGPAPRPTSTTTTGGRFGNIFKTVVGGGALSAGATVAASAAALYGLSEIDKNWLSKNDPMASNLSAFPRLNRLRNRVMKDKIPLNKLSPVEEQAFQMMMRGLYHSKDPVPRLKAAESLMDKAVAAGGGVRVHGNATVTVNIDQTDNKGNVTRKVTKVPLPLFGDFTSPAPQTGGKNKTNRK